jgi:hypothetical protein
MSTKALNNENTRVAILDFLMNYCGLYEALREKKVGRSNSVEKLRTK